MIVRNIDDIEVLKTTYIAHGGGLARMVMDSSFLQGVGFLAYALLPPGNVIDEHVDQMEEIYFILKGGGVMKVGREEMDVKEGDAIWIPKGEPHRLENTLDETTIFIAIAAYPRE